MHTEQLMDPVDSPARTMTPRNPTPHADGRTAPLTHESNPRNPICPGSSEVAVEIGDYLGLVITVDILKLQWRLVVTLEGDYLGHSEVTVKIGDYLGLVITLNILRIRRTLVIALDEWLPGKLRNYHGDRDSRPWSYPRGGCQPTSKIWTQ